MKKLILLLCIIGYSFANDVSQDTNLSINKNFIVNKKIEPNYLFANIRIESSSLLRNLGELNNDTRNSITKSLNNIILETKKGDICKGGSYSINPIISYDKNTRKTIGQDVNFMLDCKFTKTNGLDDYNELLSKINKIISFNKMLSLPQPNISYRITNDEINDTKEELFSDFLSNIEHIENKYSKLSNKVCKVAIIKSSDEYSPSPLPRAMMNAKEVMFKADSTTTEAPIVNQAEVQINITLKFICK